ncbi:MAG: sugar ABC transporter permease [Eubacterium sp.]|nr:sugar ABC transporter permease [Eubacterium sp.]
MISKAKKESKKLKKENIRILDNEGNEIIYKKKHETWRERCTASLFLGPSLIGVLIFFIIPFFVVIFYANTESVIDKSFVGLKNFQNVFNNSAFRTASKNTAMFSLITVPLAIILSMSMALILDEEIPAKSYFRTFFLSPLMVPVASVVLIWQVLFDYHGVVNQILNVFGGGNIDWFKSSYSQIVVVILFLWKNLGYNMILFMSALSAIPRDVIEVSYLDGASRFKQFWYIKLRYITPTIFFVGIMSLINSFKVFREVYLLTGDYPYDSLYMLQHFMNNTFRSLDYQKLSAAAIIMCVVMIIIIGILFIFEDKVGKDVEG